MMIGERVQKARTRQGITKVDLARRCNLTPAGIGQIESSETKMPGADNLLKIADALGVSLRYLISGDHDTRVPAAKLDIIRWNNLHLLREEKGYSLAFIARKSDTNESYLSQIYNKVIQKKGKRPRSLTVDYVEKIEAGLGLSSGWMDRARHLSEKPFHLSPEKVAIRPWNWPSSESSLDGAAAGWVQCVIDCSMSAYALRVVDGAMHSPTGKSYPPECLVFVDPDLCSQVVSGDIVIATIPGVEQFYLREFVNDGLQQFLRPFNTQYPTVYDDFVVIGKVIGKWEDS